MAKRRLQPDGAFADWWRELLRVEGYELHRVLAYGPGWETFEARVAPEGAPVTLKIFTGLAAPDRRTGFLRAADRRASLKHPNLLAVQNFGEMAGHPFLALELSECPSLAARLRTQPLDPGECVDILSGVADAVETAAEQGVITRNLAPDAILVDPLRGGLLGDLGIAQEVVGRVVIADDRLAYLSPEELRGEEIDLRASVYSLGAVAITALTGAPPHQNGGPRAGHRPQPRPLKFSKLRPSLRAGHRLTHAPLRLRNARPFLPPEINAVVARAMAHAPEHRYAGTSEFMRCMARGLTASGEATRAAPPHRLAALGLGSTSPTRENRQAAKVVRPSPSRRALRLRGFARLREPSGYMARAGSITPGRRGRGPTLPWLRPGSAYQVARASAVARGLRARATTRARALGIRASRVSRDTAVSLGVRQWAGVAAALLAVIASGAVGWLLAGAGSGEPAASVVVNRALRLQLPPGWTRGNRSEAVRVPAGAIVSYPPGDRGSGVIAFASRSSAREMAEWLLAPAGSAPARLSVVRNGDFQGWRYSPLRFGRRAEGTGFVLPTTAGSIVVICYTSDPSGTGRLPFDCRRVAAGASPLRGRLVAVQAASPAGRDLADSISQLRRRRAAALRRLARAKRSELQAAAARDLERAYFVAAGAVAALPGKSNELERLTDALRRAAAAYGSLARVAGHENADGYEAARDAVRGREQSVRRALDVVV